VLSPVNVLAGWPRAHPPTLLYCVERILSTQVGSYVIAFIEEWYKK